MAETPKGRLISLDAFRGLTIAFMVLVNNAGDGRHTYAPLEHAEWNGWTPTDMVFPSFLWIAGLAMTLSFAKRMASGAQRGQLLLQMAKRCAILYLLGLVIYGFPEYNLGTLRLLGVLQRIGICLFLASAIWLYCGLRGRIAWLVALLCGYWALMTLVPVPGYGPGRLDVEGNLAHYVDRVVLGSHNYHNTRTWDPEGIVSTLPAIGTALLGMFGGQILGARRSLRDRVLWMAAGGLALIALGEMCNFWLPVNKKLWTTSFTLLMAGLDFVIFAAFAWCVDGLKWQRPVRPFVILGMNAIAVYMAAELLSISLGRWGAKRAIYQSVFVPMASPYNASLLYALTYTAVLWCFSWVLYRRGWFLKV